MGVFSNDVQLFTTYRVTLQIEDKLMGGTPGDPKMIEGWIQSKVGVSDAITQQLWVRTLLEQGANVNETMSLEELRAAAEAMVAETKTNVFKRDAERGLYIEGRHVKAMLKENTHIMFAGDKWGKRAKGDEAGAYAGKAPKSYVAERVFVVEDRIYLGRERADEKPLLKITHTQTAQGPQSSLTYVEYVIRPTITFHVEVLNDCLTRRQWATIFECARRNGLGANRSQGYGRFDVTEFEQVPAGSVERGQQARELIGASR